jgi:hypothetical protein
MTDIDTSETLKHLLLDMMSTTRPVEASRTEGLGGAEWDVICRMAEQHRLDPILHHYSQNRGSHWAVPDGVRAKWAQSFRQSALCSLLISKTLLKIDKILNKSAYNYAALKGAWLTQKAYPHPALRPMRDVDIIVSPEHVLTVFTLLESEGFVLSPEYVRPNARSQAQAKHLSPLYDEQTGISVEVHCRLVDHADGDAVALNQIEGLLKRSIRADGVNYLNPTDTLLHLMVHTVYDHQFNNGPLTFNDIAVAVASSDIEWDRFWTMAKTGGWTRGCELLFAIVGDYHELEFQACEACSTQFAPTQLESAKLLTLQEFDQRGLIAFRGAINSSNTIWRLLSLLCKRAIPTRNALASFSGLSGAPIWVFIYYPQWLYVNANKMLFKSQPHTVDADIKRSTILQEMLHNA